MTCYILGVNFYSILITFHNWFLNFHVVLSGCFLCSLTKSVKFFLGGGGEGGGGRVAGGKVLFALVTSNNNDQFKKSKIIDSNQYFENLHHITSSETP